MIQYLLNVSVVWLLSLVLFDLCISREQYHGYNRFYLLFTLLAGALFPLIEWHGGNKFVPHPVQNTAAHIYSAKQTIIETTVQKAPATFDWAHWLMIVYWAGVAMALMILISEIIKLFSIYFSGKKSRRDNWVIIETGQEHAPYSIFSYLFVGAVGAYSDEEWNMILRHESRHKDLWHFINLLILRFAGILFWYHPLIYVYTKRLLLVHEYQADAASGNRKIYGSFLVQQAVFGSASPIVHSFNRSSIKKRIFMLTQKSAPIMGVKKLVLLPVAVICFVCCSRNTISQQFNAKGNVVSLNHDTYELANILDTVKVFDPMANTYQIQVVATTNKYPIKINGKTIPQSKDIDDEDTYFTGTDKDLRTYLIKNSPYADFSCNMK